MASKNPSKRVLAPAFIMSYPSVIEPKPYMENGVKKGDPRYQLDMLLTEESLKQFRVENSEGALVEVDIRQLAVQLAKERWPELADPAVLKAELASGWPFKDGNKMAAAQEAKKKPFEHLKGKIVVSAKSYENVPPNLSYLEGGKKINLSRGFDTDMKKAANLFAGGNWAGAELSMQATLVSQKKYITFYLNSVVYIKEGEKIGGKSMMDRFDGIYGGASTENPMEGMSAEIPF